ncbi:MAG: pyridoxal-dependent decarboxylase [Actinomycetota bacterium]|nr:pyridoxal-dependent decarboxylase [Actinomycetota bacterium]
MSASRTSYEQPLARAVHHTQAWLDSQDSRPAGVHGSLNDLAESFAGPLPEHGRDPAQVVDDLADRAEAGLMAMPSGRFYGWVVGGTLPAALAADWMVSAWDQNSMLRSSAPAIAAIEHAAGKWLLDLLGLPVSADVGFVTGATMANFTCLAAARGSVLDRVGWDVGDCGLTGAPPVYVLVGDSRHSTIDLALRYLGLGRPREVDCDEQGRIRGDALQAALDEIPAGAPIIVCLQAGDLHSGAFDDFDRAIERAHAQGAWVHVDGAFGLWAGASPTHRHLVAGVERADSWATDAHKTLNVPYDCGVAIVADPATLRTAMRANADYMPSDHSEVGDPRDKVPESSRRARGVPVWAALQSLGRLGVADLVDRLVNHARAFAEGLGQIDGVEVVNDVDFTQVCVAFGNDTVTREVAAALLADGDAWMSGSRWQGKDVIRVSVSNWSTDADDVRRSIAAFARATATVTD